MTLWAGQSTRSNSRSILVLDWESLMTLISTKSQREYHYWWYWAMGDPCCWSTVKSPSWLATVTFTEVTDVDLTVAMDNYIRHHTTVCAIMTGSSWRYSKPQRWLKCGYLFIRGFQCFRSQKWWWILDAKLGNWLFFVWVPTVGKSWSWERQIRVLCLRRASSRCSFLTILSFEFDMQVMISKCKSWEFDKFI